MKTIKIKPDEVFKVEIEVEGKVVATQCVYMVSRGLTWTRQEGHFYPIQPTIDLKTAFENKISEL